MHADLPPEDDAVSPFPSVGRRRAIGLGLTAAVAGLASVVNADAAGAASGGNFILGQANDAGVDSTSLTANNASGTLNVQSSDGITTSASVNLAFNGTGVVANGTTGVSATGTTTGLAASGPTALSATGTTTGITTSAPTALVATGTTTGISTSGVTGITASGTTAVNASGSTTGVNATGAIAVSATGIATGIAAAGPIAGVFTGDNANVRLTPGGALSPPNVAHDPGEIFVGSDVGILVCVAGGTPGTWVRLGLNPLNPVRVCDTRTGSGKPFAGQPLGPNGELTINFPGNGGVPAVGASAVVFNLTMATCTADGWMTAYPAGAGLPDTSNLNFAANQSPKANLVVVKLGTGGGVTINNARGTTNLIVDLFGFYS